MLLVCCCWFQDDVVFWGRVEDTMIFKIVTLARILMRSLVHILKLKRYETHREQWHTASRVSIVLTYYVLLSSTKLLCIHGYPGI